MKFKYEHKDASLKQVNSIERLSAILADVDQQRPNGFLHPLPQNQRQPANAVNYML